MIYRLIFISLYLFSNQLLAQEQLFSKVAFSNSTFLNKDSTKYSGRLQENYANGNTKVVSQVKDGKLFSSTKSFYQNGQLHFLIQYNNGKLCCTFSEYFENGELKLQGEIGEQQAGGNSINKMLYAYYDSKGKYINKVKGKARIQFFNAQKLSGFFNDELSPNEIVGYRIFDSSLKNYGMFIEDSRSIKAPLRP